MGKPNVLYISIDALHPEVVFDADKFGIKIPFLRSLIKKSTHTRKGAYGIFPTLTYPSHVSMVTGATPRVHGLSNNIYFDAENIHEGKCWRWFEPGKGKVDNLWSAASKSGYVTANICVPCTVGADIDYNIVEYWRDKTHYNDMLFYSLCSDPRMVEEMEKEIGFIPGLTQTEKEDDIQRAKAAIWILENQLGKSDKPFFMSAYLSSYDGKSHECRTYSKEAFEALEVTDEMVRKIVEKAEEVSGGNLVVCIVSDHGMADVNKTLKINAELKKAGFIKSDDGETVKDWTAYSHYAHGMAEVRVKDPSDIKTYNAVEKLLRVLEAAEGNGVKQVYNREQLKELGSFMDSDFVIEAELGYRFENLMDGDLHGEEHHYYATHGYSPEYYEMRSSFFLTGKDIPAGVDKGEINLIDFAPTLASVMGMELRHAEGKSIL